jgi:plastocyanin
MKTGNYHPVVIVSHVGQARIDAGATRVHVPLAITSVQPTSVGVRGSTILNITGSGFSNIGPENQVQVGNQSCSVVSATFTAITCYAPNAPGAIDVQCWGGIDCSNATSTPGAVHQVSWGFNLSAASITINEGDTISWNFDQTPVATHNLMSGTRVSPTSEFDCPYTASGSCVRRFAVAGTYPIHCTPHSGMNAVVTVVVPARRHRRDAPLIAANVRVRVFDYQQHNLIGGTFDGYDANTVDYVEEAHRLDGAWGEWVDEISAVLRDTKYYG